MLKTIWMLCTLFFLNACDRQTELKKEQFTGSWESGDGAIIELREDGTYTARKLDFLAYCCYDEIEDTMRFDMEGDWRIMEEGDRPILKLSSNQTFEDYGIEKTYTVDGKVLSYKIGMELNISGRGMLENKPPWHLFYWVGDPDDMNKYEFLKKE